MSEAKRKFIMANIWALSWNASVQHAKIYKEGFDSKLRKELSNKLKNYFEGQVYPQYKSIVKEEKHSQNIDFFRRYVTKKHGVILSDGEYRFGVAQKLFNLYLKQLWVLGLIPSPPHFPIDDLIQKLLKQKAPSELIKSFKEIKWTKNNSMSDYKHVIQFAHLVNEQLEYKDLATLELELYNSLL